MADGGWVELTSRAGTATSVQVDRIFSFCEDQFDQGKSIVFAAGGGTIKVRESYEQIKNLLGIR
jgi:hypothetical protein